MRLPRLKPDLKSFELALKNKRPEAWDYFKAISYSQEKHKLTLASLNSLLGLLKTSNDPQAMQRVDQVLHMYQDLSIPMEASSFNILIYLYCQQGKLDMVRKTLSLMKERHIEPTVDTFNQILKMHVKQYSLEMCSAIFSRIQKPNAESFDLMIEACVKHKNAGKAMEYYHEMQKLDMHPSPGSYTQLIRLYGQEDALDNIHELFEKMKSSGLKVDQYICSAILHAYAQKPQPDRIQKVLDYMHENGIEKDQAIYQALVTAKFNLKDVQGVFDLLQEIKSLGKVPDERLCQSILHGCCQLGEIDQALNFFIDIHQIRSVPLVMYRTLMKSLKDHQRPLDVYYLYDMAINEKLRLIPPIYNLVLETASENHDLIMMKKVWKAFSQDTTVEPNQISYSILLDTYIRIHDVKEAILTCQQMIKLGYEPSVENLAHLFQACIQSRRYSNSIQLLRLIKSSKAADTWVLSEKIKEYGPNFEDLILEVGKNIQSLGLIESREIKQEYVDKRDLVLDIFRELNASGMKLKEETYQYALMTYILKQDLIGSIKTWTLLQSKYPQPTAKSVSLLLKATVDLGQASTAKAVKNLIEKQNLALDQNGYESLLVLAIRYGDAEHVTHLLLDMVNHCDLSFLTYELILKTMADCKCGSSKRTYILEFIESYYPHIMEESQTLHL